MIDGGTTAIGHPDPTSRTEVGIVFSCPLFAVSTTTSQVREPPRRVEPIQSPMVGALVVRKGKALPPSGAEKSQAGNFDAGYSFASGVPNSLSR